MITIEEIRTLKELETLKDEWWALQRLAGAESIFLSHAWCLLCAKHLDKSQELLVLLLREGGNLVGIAPFVRQRAVVRHLRVSVVRFLANPLTPFADLILLEQEKGIRALLAHFQSIRADWDLLRFDKLREDSPSRPLLLTQLHAAGLGHRQEIISRTPFLPIEMPWSDFYKSTSQKFKKTRRSVTNRVQRLGQVEVEQFRRPADAELGLEQMLDVSARGWKRKRGVDLLTPQFERAFFTDLAHLAAEQDWLRLWILRRGSDALASEFHLQDGSTVYGLRAQFDPAFAEASPGTYLDSVIVQQLFEAGCRCYDMGPGAAPYKLAWTEQSYACFSIEVFNRGIYPRFLEKLQTAWIPAIKRSVFLRWRTERSGSAGPGRHESGRE